MRRSSAFEVILVTLLWTLPCLGQGDAADQAAEDWKRAAELFKTYFADLNSEYSFTGHEEEYIERWNNWRRDFVELRSEIQNRYGNTVEDITQRFEGVSAPEGVTTYMRQIAGDLFPLDVDAKQKEIAGWSVKAGDQVYARWQNLAAPDATKMELKADYARRALAAYERAAEIDPKGSYVDSIEKAKRALAESEKQWKDEIVNLKWPGHNAEFEGPGDPNTLAQEALRLLASVESWSKPEYEDKHVPIAACVTARGWEVSKKNPITEAPTQYSLDLLVAFRGTQDPEIAYAYNMVFYTKEEEGVKKEPPFRFVNSRQYAKYKMLMSNVPKMSDAATPAEGAGTAVGEAELEKRGVPSGPEPAALSSGIVGMTLRLVLASLLVVAGLAALKDYAERNVPALGSICARLQEQRKALGIALLVVGAVCFLRNTLFHFAPHADLLPQLMAIVMGLQLSHEALPQVVSEKTKGLAEPLARYAQLLGFASIGLGVFHLLFAAVVLL